MGPDDQAWTRAQNDFFGGSAAPPPPTSPGPGTTAREGGPAPTGQFGAPSPFGTPSGPGATGMRTAAAHGTPVRARGAKVTGVGHWVRYAVIATLLIGVGVVVNDYLGAWRARAATTITFPDQVAGFALVDAQELAPVKRQIEASLPPMGGGKSSTGVYTRPGGGLGMVAFAARKKIPLVPFGLREEPETIVDSLTKVGNTTGTPVSELRTVAPGKLGGRLMCARVALPNQPVTTMCAGDNATSVIAMVFEGAVNDANVVAAREAIIRKK